MREFFRLIVPALAFMPAEALAQSDVDPLHKHAWGENVGWLNWRDASGGKDGVRLGGTFLEGFIWGENVGWIDAGRGPADGMHYANTGDDHGVNVDPVTGDLSGAAWGENIGWIVFDTLDALGPFNQQARLDLLTGRLRGYAWGENVGWINLDDATHFVSFGVCPGDLDGDGDADADDFFMFLDAFAGGDFAVCDLDGDGDCDADDFFAYLDRFAQTC